MNDLVQELSVLCFLLSPSSLSDFIPFGSGSIKCSVFVLCDVRTLVVHLVVAWWYGSYQCCVFPCSIESGEVIVKKGNKVLCTLGPKAMFGEMSFLGSNITSAAVIAKTDVCVAFTSVAYANLAFFKSPSLFLVFYWIISTELATRLRDKPVSDTLANFEIRRKRSMSDANFKSKVN